MSSHEVAEHVETPCSTVLHVQTKESSQNTLDVETTGGGVHVETGDGTVNVETTREVENTVNVETPLMLHVATTVEADPKPSQKDTNSEKDTAHIQSKSQPNPDDHSEHITPPSPKEQWSATLPKKDVKITVSLLSALDIDVWYNKVLAYYKFKPHVPKVEPKTVEESNGYSLRKCKSKADITSRHLFERNC